MTEKPLQQLALDFVATKNERTFTQLHNRLKPGLKKYIQKFHTDFDTIEDILSITLSKAFILVDKYDDRWNFSTWIYKICHNECLMEIRRKNRTTSLDYMEDNKIQLKPVNEESMNIVPDYEFFTDEDVIQPHTLYDQVLDELQNLPQHYKDVLEDRIVNKMKYEDIAEKRNVKLNTVRTRIHNAKKVIKHNWIEKRKNDSSNSKTVNILGVTILQLCEEKEKTASPITYAHNSHVTILKAIYGAGTKTIDILEKFNKLFQEKGIVKVGNKIGGDPCYGQKKSLLLEYKIGDEIFEEEIKEGKTFSSQNFSF